MVVAVLLLELLVVEGVALYLSSSGTVCLSVIISIMARMLIHSRRFEET